MKKKEKKSEPLYGIGFVVTVNDEDDYEDNNSTDKWSQKAFTTIHCLCVYVFRLVGMLTLSLTLFFSICVFLDDLSLFSLFFHRMALILSPTPTFF